MAPVPQAESLEELNESILQRCLSYGSHKIAGRHRSVKALEEDEKKHLVALPQERFTHIKTNEARVDKSERAAHSAQARKLAPIHSCSSGAVLPSAGRDERDQRLSESAPVVSRAFCGCHGRCGGAAPDQR